MRIRAATDLPPKEEEVKDHSFKKKKEKEKKDGMGICFCLIW